MTRIAMLLALTAAACLDVEAPGAARFDETGLEVPGVAPGTPDGEAPADEAELEAPDDDFTDDTGPNLIFYGSTYNSNCCCLLCVKYCDVDGKTVKSGTCC